MRKVWEKQIEEIFKTKNESEETLFFQILALLLYSRENDQLATLYKIAGKDKFSDIIDELGGQNVKLPNREEYKDVATVAYCYYWKEIKGKTWKEIHEIIPFKNVNSVKYGKWIARLSRDIKSQIESIFNDLESGNDIEDFF